MSFDYRFALKYTLSVLLAFLWFPIAFLAAILLVWPFEQWWSGPDWLSPHVGAALSIFACPTGALTGAIVFYACRETKWRINFLVVLMATLMASFFAYLAFDIESGFSF